MVHTGIKNLKHKPFGGAWSIHDQDVIQFRNEAIQEFITNEKNLDHDNIKNEYFTKYREWMFSTHSVIGAREFDQCCYTHGTTESFSQFYIRYRNARRLRIKKGDYFYHSMMHRLWYGENFAWLDDDAIREGDVLVVSVPFSQTGDVPENLEDILSQCDKLQVPVMLDMAYINIAKNLKINLDHSCIEYVTSSLSKVFPLELNRVGIRLQRNKFEDQLYVINEDGYNYINIQNCYVATRLMNKFPADYIYDKYAAKQKEYCEALNIKPSRCVIFGLDYDNQHSQYKRREDDKEARLCFSRVWDGRMDA
mgnify:FL=1|jgi:hypothetical protein|tara:strand:+ start:1557 stop:2480 length:924 start_codon:yes stop_codon:yes gene_type:complete